MRGSARLVGLIGIHAFALAFSPDSSAHPGGLDSKGCHNDRKRGGYHCHSDQSAPTQVLAPPQSVPAPANVITSQSDQIKRIQSILTDYGEYSGPVDGIMNLEMNMAIINFKKSRRLRFDTFSISETLLVLDREASKDASTLPRPRKVAEPLPPSTECVNARKLAEKYEQSAKENRVDGFAAGFRAALMLEGSLTRNPVDAIAGNVAKACQQ